MRWSSLGIASVCAACIAVAAEVTVRIDDWARFGTPIIAPANSIDDLMVRDAFGAHARPGAVFRHFRINSLGFRGPEVDTTAREGKPLIFTSGASETFGLYESPGKEWPRQLEDSLADACQGISPTVLNAGLAGMSLPTVEQDVRLRLSRYRPTAVVYYPTPLQYVEADLPRAAAPAVGSALPLLQLRTPQRFRDALKQVVPDPVLDFIRRWMLQRMRAGSNIKPLDSVPQDRLAAFESDLRTLVHTVRAAGAIPVLVVHQHRFGNTMSSFDRIMLVAWERFVPRVTGPTLLAFEAEAAERTRKVAKETGAVLVDPTLDHAGPKGEMFADFSHFNDRGAAVLAGEIARRFTKADVNCLSNSSAAD